MLIFPQTSTQLQAATDVQLAQQQFLEEEVTSSDWPRGRAVSSGSTDGGSRRRHQSTSSVGERPFQCWFFLLRVPRLLLFNEDFVQKRFHYLTEGSSVWDLACCGNGDNPVPSNVRQQQQEQQQQQHFDFLGSNVVSPVNSQTAESNLAGSTSLFETPDSCECSWCCLKMVVMTCGVDDDDDDDGSSGVDDDDDDGSGVDDDYGNGVDGDDDVCITYFFSHETVYRLFNPDHFAPTYRQIRVLPYNHIILLQ